MSEIIVDVGELFVNEVLIFYRRGRNVFKIWLYWVGFVIDVGGFEEIYYFLIYGVVGIDGIKVFRD